MFNNISRRDLSIVVLLSGILIGMVIAIFLRFSLDAKTLNNAMLQSCGVNNPDKVIVSLFGKSLDIQCDTGEIVHYNLLILNGNSADVNHHGQ